MKLNERARGSDVTAAAERAGRVDDERRELRTDLNTIRSGFNRNRATKPIARCKQKRDGGGSEMGRGEGRCIKRERERESHPRRFEMQIDVVTHDATAHRSNTKSRQEEPAPAGGVNE